MLELLPRLLQTDHNGLILVVLLCAWALFIVRRALPHPLMAVVIYPAFIFAALATDALLRRLGLLPTSDKVVNLAFATGAGITTAFAVFITLYWAVTTVRSR